MPKVPKKQKRKTVVDPAPAKKRGNQGDFHGQRKEYLLAMLPGYIEASDNGTTRKYWKETFFPGYWAKFPWELRRDEEPPEDLTGYGKSDEECTEEEFTTKHDTMKKTDEKIKRWMNYRRRADGGGSPFTKWLSQLRRVEERAPKRLAPYQVYMQDEDNNSRINELFKERYPDEVGKPNTIKYRGKIARELFAEEPEEIQEEYREKGEEDYQEAMDEFKEGGDGNVETERDAGIQREARERLAVTVQPLLDAIRAITGSQVLFITGTIVDGKFDVRTLHAHAKPEEGIQQGLDFTGWDTKGFKVVMDQWMRYLIAASNEPGATGPLEPNDSRAATGVPLPTDGSEGALPTAPTVTVPPPTSDTDTANATANAANATADADAVNDAANATAVTTPPAPPTVSTPPIPSTNSSAPPAPPTDSSAPPEPPAESSAPDDAQNGGGNGDDDAMGPNEEEDEEDPLDEFPDMGSPLRRAVRALTPDALELRLAIYRMSSSMERRRENTMATTREQLDKLGLGSEVKAIMDEVRAANKRKAGDGDKHPKKRRKGDDGDEEDYTDDEDEGSEGGGGGNAEGDDGAAARGRRVTRVARRRGAGKKRADSETGWATHSREVLLKTDEGEQWKAGGEKWEGVVAKWWAKEEAASFQGPAKGAGTKLRPKQVGAWIKRARTGGPQPTVSDTFGFSVVWWKWWVSINPDWRKRKDGGRRMERDTTTGDWGVLQSQTGPNGLLNVLICLRWWKDAMRMEAGDWDEALEDVSWVLDRLAEARAESPP
ncbi:hypothetical protein R3P38DRAFT_3203083 [Favolaschia claudopus]|uniref:Uncharacterized protein n=1 Tax=Favolaschia claudopus TaxID=2862362 RepID=A0AAW0AT57_9AGAR